MNQTPRGSQIIYLSQLEGAAPTIECVRADGSQQQHIAAIEAASITSVDCHYPTQRLVAAPNDEEQPYLYLLNFDGSGLTRSPKLNGRIYNAAFSPDGSQIMYATEVIHAFINPDYEEYLGLVDLQQKTDRQLLNQTGIVFGSPRWLPDGNRIIYAYHPVAKWFGNHGIGIINLDGTEKRSLIESPERVGQPEMSPDGHRILFIMEQNQQTNIYTMQSDGTQVRQLTHDAGNNTCPRWSPDGQRISFSSDRAGQGYRIYTMDINGGDTHQLTDLPSGDHFNQCWL